MPSTDEMSRPVTHGELREAFAEHTTIMLAEIARMIRSSEESLRSYFGVMLDKASADDAVVDARYSDLPPRVTRLEAAVFPPKRQRRR